MIAGLLLAAGRSRRFGADKLCAKLDGKAVIRWSMAALSPLDSVYVVIAPGADAVTQALSRLDVRFVVNLGRDEGMASSIRAGIAALPDDVAAVVIALGDQPRGSPAVTRALVDPTARRPSIETLLHAFLPAKHIDHVHADAICALTNQAEGERAVREALGAGFAYVDWMRPGFALSKIAGELGEYDGIVLAHHGLIVWDDQSAACLDRTLAAVAKADAYLNSLTDKPQAAFRHDDASDEQVIALMLELRGALAKEKKQVLRIDSRLRDISDRPDVIAVANAGVSSADHMLRMKPWAAALGICRAR